MRLNTLSGNKWHKLLDENGKEIGVEIKVYFPTPEQRRELDRIGAKIFVTENVKDNQKRAFDLLKIREERELSADELIELLGYFDTQQSNYFNSLYVKYTVKGWKGLEDEEGNPFECELQDGDFGEELSDKCFYPIFNNKELVLSMFRKAQEEIEVSKKKYNSLRSSNMKVDSKAED